MVAPILVTKLFLPAPRPELVPRPGLIAHLDQGLNCKLTLISAPAGFGKTTLVTDWLQQHIGDDESSLSYVAWFSLDEGDNDLVCFLTYLTEALNRLPGLNSKVGIGAQNMLQSPQPPPAATILITLINEMAVIGSKITLVLDDYHLIDAQPVHEAINFLIENQPPNFHLVIVTREDPPLPLSRLRVRDQLSELRAKNLRFSPTEATEFLNQIMGLNLSLSDIVTLESRTEGWIAGLQLAAISMRGRDDAASFIQSFTGSNRLVLDYLIEEVLNQQPANVQNFLLQTSILNSFTSSLCDAVTGQNDGQAILEMLERTNLFIISLDNKRQWYRYHHLFADILRQRLHQTNPEQLQTLHSKASAWYKQNKLFDQAIEHALINSDYEQAADLIQGQFDALWQRGEHGKLRKWLTALPEEVLLKAPQLGSIRAYYLHNIGQHHQGEQLLQKVEKTLTVKDATQQSFFRHISDLEKMKLLGRISVLRGLIDASLGNVKGMIAHTNQALEDLPEDDLTWRSLATFSLGDAYSFLGDMSASFRFRTEALQACEAAGNAYYVIMANMKLAVTLREQGRLGETAVICQKQIAAAEKLKLSESATVGFLMTLLGEIHAEWNDIERGIELAQKGVEIAERSKNIITLGFCYLNLLRILFSDGKLADAEDLINKIRSNNPNTPMAPWLPGQLAIWQAKIWLTRKELEAAAKWEKEEGLHVQLGYQVPAEIDYHSLFLHIISARILIAQNQLKHAIELLQHLSNTAEENDRITSLLEIKMLLALAYQSNGDIEQAIKAVEQALALAKSMGYFRIFVDEGPLMGRLLYETLQRDIHPEVVQRLLKVFPVIDVARKPLEQIKIDQSEWIEQLSEREIEVLQLIAKGLTNRVIASKLFLSAHTIKTHTRNIYGKLGVNNRTQAVEKGRSLGILPFD